MRASTIPRSAVARGDALLLEDPHEHLLEQQEYLRGIPAGKNLDEVFLHRERRKVRKDGTVRWQGGLLEVRPELVGEKGGAAL